MDTLDITYKFGGTVYNGVPVGYSINPNMVISAFANEMDWNKVEKYTEVMKEQMLSHDFPPIMGYPIIISEEDLGNNFINGEEITDEFIGQRAWVVTDGHHRVFAALEAGLPMLEVKLDYSTVTNMEEYFDNGGEIKKEHQEFSDITTLKYYENNKELGYLKYYYYTDETISIGLDKQPYNFSSEMYIDFVRVNEDVRNKGIAKKLIKKAISDAKELGIDVITLKRDSGIGCNYGGDYDNYLKKIYSSIGFIETWNEIDVNESKGEKNICAMHLDVNKYHFDNGGNVEDKTRIANEILKQLGGAGRLNAMTGAYNFIALPNGLSFRIKNPKANYVKVTLNGMDLYDLEVGRIRADKYKIVSEEKGLYSNMLKRSIEKATGMYLSLENGGNITIRKPNLIPDPIFKKKQRLTLKSYGEVIVVDYAFLEPPLSPFNDYMYTVKLVYDRKKELSFYEYELEMMLEDYDTGIDYEKSYDKYLSAGIAVIGNPPLTYNKFIEKINKSLYYSKNTELELSEKFTNFLKKYAVYTYSTGGQLQETKMKKTYSDRATLKEVKETSERVSMRVNEIKSQLRWHEGKSVPYPITENEKKIIQDGLPELRKERERLYKIYSDMKDKNQSTISSNSVSIKAFDVKFSYAVRLLNNKYIINYSELNKTQKVDNQYYSSYDLIGVEREIKQQTDLLAEKTGDYTDFIELMKLKTDKTEKALNQPQVLLQFAEEDNNLIIVSLSDYLESIEDKYSDFKVIYSTDKFEVPKKRKVTDVDLEPIEIQAIKDVLTLSEYSRLTQEEAEYVYSKFKNYESLVDEYGEYVAEVKEPYGDKKIEEFHDLMDTLYKKYVVMYDSYNETIEAYKNTIDLVNSVRGRIATLSAKKGGTDLFPEADLVNQAENEEIDSIKDAVDYLQSEADAGDEDSAFALDYLKDELRSLVSQTATYAAGGEIKYFEIHKGDKPVLKVKFKKDKDESSKDRTIEMLDKLSDRGYHFKEVSEAEYKKFDYSKVDNNDVVDFMSNSQHFENGGKIKFNKKKVPSSRIYNYALKIKLKHPKVWELGGNIFGNQAFKNLEKVIKRGYWLESERWMFVKWQSYVARHHKDYRIEGVIAMLKWIDTTDKGWDYMKDLIEEEIKKQSENG